MSSKKGINIGILAIITVIVLATYSKYDFSKKATRQTKVVECSFTTVTLNDKGEEIEKLTRKTNCFVETLDNDVVLEMVEIPAGSFLMGSKEDGQDHEVERPQHQVNVAGFYMGKFEITQAQWKAVMDGDPSYFKGETFPVENVSWEDAKEFCKRLSKKTGKQYRLPSEAEWEYACRAGTNTPFAFGETIRTEIVNSDGKYPYANAPTSEGRKRTVEVGSLGVANRFGLYDMHGNVWEWCEDVWHDSYQDAPNDGSPWLIGGDSTYRVLRGGSWTNFSAFLYTASRGIGSPTTGDKITGFRVVVSKKFSSR